MPKNLGDIIKSRIFAKRILLKEQIMRLSEERYISLLTDFGFKQELREYEDSLKAYRDIKNSIDTAKEEGRKEGREEG